MNNEVLLWHIYEITSSQSSLNGVMLRGRIRKLGIENGFNVFAENTTDVQNGVRFAVLNEADANIIKEYLRSNMDDILVTMVAQQIPNPVLSKLKVNDESRYTL